MFRILRVLLALTCFLVVFYAGWISTWIITRGHMPFGPIIGALILFYLGQLAWPPGIWPKGDSRELNEGEQKRANREKLDELFACLQLAVFRNPLGVTDIGAKLSDWTDASVRLWTKSRSDSATFVQAARALREADQGLHSLSSTTLKDTERKRVLKRVEEKLAAAEASLDTVTNGEAATK